MTDCSQGTGAPARHYEFTLVEITGNMVAALPMLPAVEERNRV